MKYDANLMKTTEPPLTMADLQTYHQKHKKQGHYPLRCLVVDDDGIILKIVAHMLTMIGFQKIDTAQNKPELKNGLASGSYDLLVTDLMMPDMNGYDLALKIKKETHDTKVIIMTGRDMDSCLEMMATQKVDGWLFKPFGIQDLNNTLNGLGVVSNINTADTCTHHAHAIDY